MTQTIKLITFDLDNTLWENDSVIRNAEKQLHRWFEQHAPAVLVRFNQQELLQLRLELVQQEPSLAARLSDLRKRAIQQALELTGTPEERIPELVEQAFAHFIDARNRVTLFPQARPLLEQLQGRYTLGALTNGNSDITRVGIAPYFAISLSSESVGRRKPEPDMFLHALEQAGVTAEQTVHIGDHPFDDVHGAAQLGIRTIWFNDTNRVWEDVSDKPKPDATVACLSDIPSVLDRFDAKA